jgi:hypothetical protein
MYPLVELFGQEVSTYFIMIMAATPQVSLLGERSKIYSIQKLDAFTAYLLAGFGALMGGSFLFLPGAYRIS